jgi:hypothetical protein
MSGRYEMTVDDLEYARNFGICVEINPEILACLITKATPPFTIIEVIKQYTLKFTIEYICVEKGCECRSGSSVRNVPHQVSVFSDGTTIINPDKAFFVTTLEDEDFMYFGNARTDKPSKTQYGSNRKAESFYSPVLIELKIGE